MRIFLKFLKWISITLGLLLALFIGINAFDETLDPGAAAILNAPPKVRAEDNAYFYVVGLRAPMNRAPSEFGQQCVSRLTAISKSRKETIALFRSGKTGCSSQEKTLEWKDVSTIACEQQKEGCFSHYQKQGEAIKRLAEQNKTLLQRYEQLLAMEQFEDAPYTNYVTIGLQFDLIKELYSAISVIKLQEGNIGEFVQRTSSEARFARMVLHGNSNFTSKLIASYMLNRAAHLTSDAVRVYPALAHEHAMALLSISQPLTVAERSLESARVADLRLLNSGWIVDAANEESSFFDRALFHFTFKYNATINRAYQNLSGWRDLSQLPTEQYLASGKAALARLTRTGYSGYVNMIYNPVGKYLLGLSNPTYGEYPRRIIDIAGQLRLVSLQIQIAAQKIPESEIPAFLKNADPAFRDPYTGQPMLWDKTRGIYFKGYGRVIPGQDGFISVKP